ncbi:MAG: 2,5-diketo-D-gluconate reductase [Solirubrobacteraceae bacterium]|nr:2,5-diketo-D-gluconate reductase [Solirubrobacteraceae bacterium]
MPLTTLPSLGLGTWQMDGAEAREAVRDALELGYRHIDTARMYANEREVGEGVREAGVDRGDVWITTKVWRDDLDPDRLRRSAEGSLKDLGLDQVDLLLVHWPNPAVRLGDTLAALHRVRQDGLARHIGVANFPGNLLREAISEFPIFCNQVEYHPYLSQRAVLDVAHSHGIVVTAYSPLGSGGLLKDPVLAEIAQSRGCAPAQVALRWLLDQTGVAAIPKAASHANRATNLGALELTPLTFPERAAIDALARGKRFVNPSFAPQWDK